MNFDEFRKERRHRQANSILNDRITLQLKWLRAREQTQIDEEGCGAVICAIRLGKRRCKAELRHYYHRQEAVNAG